MGSWELPSAVRNHTPLLGLCGLLTAKLSLQPQRRMFIVTNHYKEYILVLSVLSEQGIPIYLTASIMITYRSKSKTLEIARKVSFSNSSGLPTFLGVWGGKGTPVLFLLLFHLCQTFLLVSCFLLFCLWTSRLTADEKPFRLFYGKMYLFVASLLLQGFSLRLRLLQIAVFLSRERSSDRKTRCSNELFEGILLSAFLGFWMQEVSQSVVCCW